MKTATAASARTANAARTSLNGGLRIAFRSGAVMGLVVVGLGLLDISFWYLLLDWLIPEGDMPTAKLCMITTTMLTFGMGASTQALFARVGGGIYTKAADVGADLVGKVEANIPEDDPRNPATIADNVGDNVGDVAGMGADLYESYCGSILATASLGAAAYMLAGNVDMQIKAVMAPMLIAAVGFIVMAVGSMGLLSPNEQKVAGEAAQFVSPSLLINTYLVLTFAELFLSPMGISFVSKVAPPKLKGMMMGGWFVATALGNMLTVVGSMFWGDLSLTAVWGIFVVLCLISALFMFVMMKRLEKVA
jgi:K(+)-stimulated pyrophosphate-energized sodium pump